MHGITNDSITLREHACRVGAVAISHQHDFTPNTLRTVVEYQNWLNEQASRLENASERLAAVGVQLAADYAVDAKAACRSCGDVFPIDDPQEEGHDCPACTYRMKVASEAHCWSCGSRGECRCWQTR